MYKPGPNVISRHVRGSSIGRRIARQVNRARDRVTGRRAQREDTFVTPFQFERKVMESRKEYDWDRNRPVEHRPFIKEIDGKTHFFWLTTVVTARLGEKGRFIAGSIPDVVRTDAQYNTTMWLNAKAPDTWIAHVQEEMRPQWESR